MSDKFFGKNEVSEMFHQITLERKDFCQAEATDLIHFKYDAHVQYDLKRMVEQLRASIYGQPVQSVEYKHPSDWFQAFKERWYPKWLLKRSPVEYITYKSTDYHMYPDIKPSFEGQRMWPCNFTERVS